MHLSQPTLEPHSLCYTCLVQVVYSLLPTLLFSSCSLWGHPTATQFPATRRSSPGATRSTTLKWAPTFSSIYYEQVALLHPPNRLASNKTKEFFPKHVPHVYKDHIGKIHLALIPIGR